MTFVGIGADKKKMRRRGAVRRPEKDGTGAAGICDEKVLENIRIEFLHVKKGGAGANRRRSGLFARRKPPEQRVRIVNKARRCGQIGHVAQNAGFRLRPEGEVDGLLAEKTGYVRIGAGYAAMRFERFVVRGKTPRSRCKHEPLSPFVQTGIVEKPVAAALYRLELPALGGVFQLRRFQLYAFRRLPEIELHALPSISFMRLAAIASFSMLVA